MLYEMFMHERQQRARVLPAQARKAQRVMDRAVKVIKSVFGDDVREIYDRPEEIDTPLHRLYRVPVKW